MNPRNKNIDLESRRVALLSMEFIGRYLVVYSLESEYQSICRIKGSSKNLMSRDLSLLEKVKKKKNILALSFQSFFLRSGGA